MKKNTSFILTKALIVGAVLLIALPVSSRGNEVEVDLQGASVGGGETAPIKLETVTVTYQDQSVDGIKATIEFRENAWPEIRIPTDVSAIDYNTLVFTVKFDGNEDAHNFGVWILDQNGNYIGEAFLKFANPSNDGWYEFRWDFSNYLSDFPEKQIDLGNIKNVWIKAPMASIPEGGEIVMTFGQMRFEVGTTSPTEGEKTAETSRTQEVVAPETQKAPDAPLPKEGTVPVQLDSAVIAGKSEGLPITTESVEVTHQGESYQGLKLEVQHSDRHDSVRIALNHVDGEHYNTLQFKARVRPATSDSNKFNVRLINKNTDWAQTRADRHSEVLGDGLYQFSWDIVNQPDVRIMDMSGLKEIQIICDFSRVPEGKTDEIILFDMNFVSGQRVSVGDPELYAQWKEFLANYKPDYSDSSKFLLPPETGRIASPQPLTTNGKSNSQIIVPKDASDPLRLAGTELQHWLKEISGAEIEIISEPGSEKGTQLLLGHQFATGKFDEDIAALGDTDGFAVRTEDKNIYIFGATDKGTLNGVFAFLENNTDIIWVRPLQEISTVFTKNPNVSAVWADAREKPGTRYRGWEIKFRDEAHLWAVRNRNNFLNPEGTPVKENAEQQRALGNRIHFGGGHNIGFYLGKNPDFYPVIEGEKPEVFNIWKHQPNFTAPGVADAVAANALARIKESAPSYIDALTIHIEDNWGLSTDLKSLEPIVLPDGSKIGPEDPAFRSTQFFIFMNEVVEKITAVHPDMMVETYAYFFTADAPKVPVHPNLSILFCPYPPKDLRSPLFAPISDVWWQQMKAWAEMTPNVVMREYIGIFNGFRPIAEMQAANVRSFLPYGIKDYTSELFSDDANTFHGKLSRADESWNFLAQEYWVVNRIYWDPNQDVEQLRKYFIRRTYREAAPQMEEFFGIIRSQYFDGTFQMGFIDNIPFMNQIVIQHGHEDRLRELLTEAAAAAKHPTSQQLIALLRGTFDKWAAEAKDPKSAPVNPPFKHTAKDQLLYGWKPHVDWEAKVPVWAAATFLNEDGKPVSAVRVTLHPERNLDRDFKLVNQFEPGLLGVQSGDIFTLTINPATQGVELDPSQLILTATDEEWIWFTATEAAVEKTPRGGFKISWKLDPPADAAKPFNFAKIKELALTIPKARFEGTDHEIVFYLTDLSLGNIEM